AADGERALVRADHDPALDLKLVDRRSHGDAGRFLRGLLVGAAEPARAAERRPLRRADVHLAAARPRGRLLGARGLGLVGRLGHCSTALNDSPRVYTTSMTSAIACSMFPFWITGTSVLSAWSRMKSWRWRMSPSRSRYFSSARVPPVAASRIEKCSACRDS